jgi:hypothetical protein
MPIRKLRRKIYVVNTAPGPWIDSLATNFSNLKTFFLFFSIPFSWIQTLDLGINI